MGDDDEFQCLSLSLTSNIKFNLMSSFRLNIKSIFSKKI